MLWGEEGSLLVISLSLLTIITVKIPVLSPKLRGILLLVISLSLLTIVTVKIPALSSKLRVILLSHKKQLSSCDEKD